MKNYPSRVKRSVGRQIAALRVARKWTQEQLSERVSVSWRYLQSVEAGDENLTIESLSKIANALRVELRILLAVPVAPAAPKRARKAKKRKAAANR